MASARYCFGATGKQLEWAMISTIVAFGFVAFGYDNGVAGSVLDLESFTALFPSLDATVSQHNAQIQGTVVATYTLGAFVGSLASIFIGDPLGRKRMIGLAAVVHIVGAVLQSSSFSIAQLVVGRLCTGAGVGLYTATTPNWQSECAGAAHRGAAVVIDGFFISLGLALQGWIALGSSFGPGSFQWRFPLAVSGLWTMIVLAALPLMPESPRWLVKHGRDDEARHVLAALHNHAHNGDEIDAALAEIRETVAVSSQGRFRDLLRNGDLRLRDRTLIAVAVGMWQQLNGINSLGFYLNTVFHDYLQLSSLLARILSSCVFTFQTLCAPIGVVTVDRLGRRTLMLVGAIGMGVCMVVVTGGVSHPADKASVSAAAAFIFLFSFFFPVGILGVSFLYASELSPLQYRVPITALSSASVWLANFIVVETAPAGFANIGYRYYIIYAVLNLVLIAPAVYFFFPETAGRPLEEVDLIFQQGGSIFEIVRRSKTKSSAHVVEHAAASSSFGGDEEKATTAGASGP